MKPIHMLKSAKYLTLFIHTLRCVKDICNLEYLEYFTRKYAPMLVNMWRSCDPDSLNSTTSNAELFTFGDRCCDNDNKVKL